MVQCCVVLCCDVRCRDVQCCAVRRRAVVCGGVRCGAARWCVVRWCVVLYCAVRFGAVQGRVCMCACACSCICMYHRSTRAVCRRLLPCTLRTRCHSPVRTGVPCRTEPCRTAHVRAPVRLQAGVQRPWPANRSVSPRPRYAGQPRAGRLAILACGRVGASAYERAGGQRRARVHTGVGVSCACGMA